MPRRPCKLLGARADCVVDIGRRYDADRLLFGHKPAAIEDRHSTCSAKLLWEYLRDAGRPVVQLWILVQLVWDGDSARRRRRSAICQESLKSGLHAELVKQREVQQTDRELYRVMRDWLDHRFRSEIGASAGAE